MEIEKLKNYIDKGYSQRQIAELEGKSQGSIKHWLKKYKLKTTKVFDSSRTEKICPKCKIKKSIDNFYKRKDSKNSLSSRCKHCLTLHVLETQRKFKLQCVEYKGSQCKKCGYNKCIGALEFHHLDPNQKDFEISKFRLMKFNEKAKQELDKCILVCANCHREIHSNI